MADVPQKPSGGIEPIKDTSTVSLSEGIDETKVTDIEKDPDIQELEKELKNIVTEALTSPSSVPESGVLEHKGSAPSSNPQEDISHILESEKIAVEPTPEPAVMKTEVVDEPLPQELPYVPTPIEKPVVEEQALTEEVTLQEKAEATELETPELEEVSDNPTEAPLSEVSTQQQEENQEPTFPDQTVQTSVEVPFETKASFHIEEPPEPPPVENKKMKILTLLLLIVLFLILSLIVVSVLRKQGQFPFLQGLSAPSISLQKKPPSLPPDTGETSEKPEAKLFTESETSPSASESLEASKSSEQ